MNEYFTTEDFMKPLECLTEALDNIQGFYLENRIKDIGNADALIDSYSKAIDLLTKEVSNDSKI